MRIKDFKEFARSLFGESGPEIRPMVEADLEEVLRIIRLHDSDDYHAAVRSFEHADLSGSDPYSAQHFVLIEPGELRPVGVSGYYIDDLESQGIYWLGWTYVNPFFRGRGYGGMLLHFVMRSVRTFGARKIYLSTSDLPEYQDAVRFYERYGFREEGRLVDYFREGEAKLILAVDL